MEKIVLSETEIQGIVTRLGQEISRDYQHEELPPIILCVMKGAMVFCADLIRHIDIDVLVDYIQVKSWSGTKSTGVIHMLKDVTVDLTGRDVIVVEDIVDTGYSMKYLFEYLRNKFQMKSLKVCALLDKPSGRQIEFKADYVGHTLVGNEFLVGYGLDYKGLVRNAPCIYVPSKEEIQCWDKTGLD